jgi:methylmalonyl-CoA mutase C-terminal domain/subunit
MEVIYTGLRQTPEQIVTAALQEDVDALLLSILSGAHNHLFPRITQLLREKGAENILVIGGGVIPQDDIPGLQQAGIREVFGPGTSTEFIVNYVRENVT